MPVFWLAALLAVGFVAGCGGGGGGGATTQSYGAKPLKPNDYSNNGDPDSQPGTTLGASTTLTSDGKGHFTLRVQNQSSFGAINDFAWSPPPTLTVTSVTGSSKGSCRLAGGIISCQAKIEPPKCTCQPGPSVLVHFSGKTVKGFGNDAVGYSGSSLRVGGITPVPYIIPSSPNPLLTTVPDLPLCAPGEASTARKPCVQPG
ncbi:MAG: hypothetical protein QOE43_1301 [Gaiellaceae bacterium]|jgi:hypothetical protein|nr:hypothetical protein [Gaiellaceae bacterium]